MGSSKGKACRAYIGVEQIGVEELAGVHQVAVHIAGSLIGGGCIAVRHKSLQYTQLALNLRSRALSHT